MIINVMILMFNLLDYFNIDVVDIRAYNENIIIILSIISYSRGEIR